MFQLPSKRYLMFIGGLVAEIKAIVWRNWKISWSSPMYISPIKRLVWQLFSVHTNGENRTKSFFDSEIMASISASSPPMNIK